MALKLRVTLKLKLSPHKVVQKETTAERKPRSLSPSTLGDGQFATPFALFSS
jgi:hypothetical protein